MNTFYPSWIKALRPVEKPPKPRERNKAHSAFYQSRPWREVREVKLLTDPLCESCKRRGRTTTATIVHHLQPLEERPDLALSIENLSSSCAPCHNRLHPEKGKKKCRYH